MGVDYSELVTASAQLAAAGPRVEPGAKLVARKTGYDGVSDAQVAAPVETGYLESTIAVDIDPDGLGWTLYTTADYGAHVEYGTDGPYVIPNAFGRGDYVMHPGISPQPYMNPAYDAQLVIAETALSQVGYQALS